MESFPSCPECGGPRAFFEYRVESNKTFITLGMFSRVYLYACTCLACGHTTIRPRPSDLAELREASAKGNAVDL
jgi:hypothetical protein